MDVSSSPPGIQLQQPPPAIEMNEQPPPYFPPEFQVPQQIRDPNLHGYGRNPDYIPMYVLPMRMLPGNNYSLDLFNEAVGANQRLIFDSEGISANGLFSVDLKSEEGHPILAIMTSLGGQSSYGNVIVISETSIKFMDKSGQILLFAKEELGRNSISVGSDDRRLGMVEGFRFFTTSILARNMMGGILFKVVAGDSTSPSPSSSSQSKNKKRFTSNVTNFLFMADGKSIATLSKRPHESDPSKKIVQLELDPDLEETTKAMVIVAAHFLYINYFIKASSGSGGLRGARKCQLIKIFILTAMVILFVVLAITVPTLLLLKKSDDE